MKAHVMLIVPFKNGYLMKKYLLAAVLLLGSQVVTAKEKCTQAMSNMSVGKTHLECVNVTGNAVFNGTTVGKLTVGGNLEAKSAHIQKAKVLGRASLNRTTVAGALEVTGELSADESTLQNVDVTAKSVMLKRSTVNNIEVSAKKDGLVYLDHTTVQGDIRFTGGKGVVMKKESTIEGQVMNGEVEE